MFLHKVRQNPQVIGILFALCLALVAQYLYTGELFIHQLPPNTWVWKTKYSLASVSLLCAIGFAFWAAFPREKVEAQDAETMRFLMDEPKGTRIWLFGSGVSYVLSILLYLLAGENSLVHWLWLAGIGLLVIPLWLQIGVKPAEDRIPSWEWILVGIISLIGFGIRYWKLTEIPSHVDNDVALMGTFARQLIESGQYNWIGFSDSAHLLSYDQFQAWGMRLFGQNHYGIVMHSVVLGTLSLFLTFLLGRELGGRFVGFVAIGLLTISYTHIHFSRILFGNSASFVSIFVLYMIFKGLRMRRPFWFAIAGVFAGWGLLLYDSSRVLPLILLSLVIWQWVWQRQLFKSMYKNWLILLAGIIVGFGPMLAYAIRNFSTFLGRTNTVVLWNPVTWEHEMASYHTSSPIQVLVHQTWRTFLTLHLTGDGSPHFAFPHPMVSQLTALLFVLGLGYALSMIKSTKYFSILGWIFLTFIFGGVLTADPPYWPHLNIVLPAIALVAAVGAKSLADKLETVFGRVGYKVYSWVLLSVIIVNGINNLQVYYDFVKNNAGNRVRIARYLESLPSSYNVYMVSQDFSWNEYAFRFFSHGMTGQDLLPETLATDPPVIEHATVFILFQNPGLVAALEGLYPDGEMENHYNFDNLVSFISYRVVPSSADVPPESPNVSSLSLPGWQLIFGLIIFWVGYVAYQHYSSTETAESDEPPITMRHLD